MALCAMSQVEDLMDSSDFFDECSRTGPVDISLESPVVTRAPGHAPAPVQHASAGPICNGQCCLIKASLGDRLSTLPNGAGGLKGC